MKLKPTNIIKEESHTVTNIDNPNHKQTSIRQVFKPNTDLVSKKKNTFDDYGLSMNDYIAEDATLKQW